MQVPYTALPSAFRCVRGYRKIVSKALGTAQLCLKSLSLESGLLKTFYTERDSQPAGSNLIGSLTHPIHVHCTLSAGHPGKTTQLLSKVWQLGLPVVQGARDSGANLQLLKQPNVPLVLALGKPQLPSTWPRSNRPKEVTS